MKKRGFTLIELLAVIIILGILMLIAIPSVTSYINNSRKQSYVSTIKELIKGTSNLVNSGDLEMFDTDTTYYVPCNCIDTENGSVQSPYGKLDKSYVVTTYDGDNYNYYYTGRDIAGMGIKNITLDSNIKSDYLDSNIESTDIKNNIGVGFRSKVQVLDETDCKSLHEVEKEGSVPEGGRKPHNKCPDNYTSTIYWALQDTDSDSIDDKLIISDSEVNGNKKGSFAGNSVFNSWNDIPWFGIHSSQSGDPGNFSYKVNKIEIQGTVVPTSTAYWFMSLGFGTTEDFNVDLSNLEVCKVTTMENMFSQSARSSPHVNLIIDGWNTSSLVNMDNMFSGMAYSNNQSFVISGLDDFDTSHVTTISHLFNYTAQTSTSMNVGNLGKWDTSSLIEMDGPFIVFASRDENWNIGDIGNWDTRNVTNMRAALHGYGGRRDTVILDLRRWDTSKVTNMYYLFNAVGYAQSKLDIDISTWNLSNVESIGGIFTDLGSRTIDWKVTIPKTNGNGLNNTSTTIYGKNSSVSASPSSGKSFTVAS